MNVTWKNCFKIGISLFLLYLAIVYLVPAFDFLTLLADAAAPLFIGCIIAYIVNIIMSFYEKYYFPKSKSKYAKYSRRPVCVLLAFATLIFVIVIIVALVLPQLISCIKVILDLIPPAMQGLVAWIKSLNLDIVPESFLNAIDWENQLSSLDLESQINRLMNIVDIVTSSAGSVVDTVLKLIVSLFSGLVTAVVSIVFSVYLLCAKGRLKEQFIKLFNRYLSDNVNNKIRYILDVFDRSFHGYFVAQCAEAVILGILCSLGMIIFDMPYPTMIGALIAFTALVPIVGAFIGASVGAFMILTVSPFKALMFIVFIIVLQQIEENLIYPKVVGSSVNLPGIWVLAAITICGGVMGVLGMLIAVPIAAALYRLLKDDVAHGKKAKKVKTEIL